MAALAAPSSAAKMTRWRTTADRLLVLVIILAAWQIGSAMVGAVLAELAVGGGVALRRANCQRRVDPPRRATRSAESVCGALVGGVPAVLLPFLLRRHPLLVAILDPFMVGGYGAPKLAFAPLFILWFGIGIEFEDRPGGERGVLHRLFQHAVGRARARSQAGADGADRRRQRAARGAPHRVSGRGAAYLRRLPHRRAVRDRRRHHRRADLRRTAGSATWCRPAR